MLIVRTVKILISKHLIHKTRTDFANCRRDCISSVIVNSQALKVDFFQFDPWLGKTKHY